jgi:hypothetical protein
VRRDTGDCGRAFLRRLEPFSGMITAALAELTCFGRLRKETDHNDS